jgi:hypothetical protein
LLKPLYPSFCHFQALFVEFRLLLGNLDCIIQLIGRLLLSFMQADLTALQASKCGCFKARDRSLNL